MLFYKYLISYLIIFLLPFTTISIIFYNMSTNNLKKEIINSNMAKLEQVRDLTDARISELSEIAMRISFDHRLTPYKLNQPYSSKEGIYELINYQVNSSIIDALLLVYNDEKLTYSSKGTSTLDNMIDNVYPLASHEKELFKQELELVTQRTFKSVALEGNKDKQQNILTYIYPIPPQSTNYYGSVVFFIQESSIKQLISNILGDFKGNTYIFNKENEIIVSNNVGESLSSEYVSAFNRDGTGVFNKKINGEDYSLVTVSSSESDWTFVSAMPTAQFYSQMSAMKTTIFVMLSIIALLGVGITIYLSLKQYQPIQKLVQSIRKRQEHVDTANSKRRNELERIRETIEFIFDDTDKMRQKMDLQEPFVRDQFLLKLLKERISLDEKMAKILSDVQISFNGEHFFVVVIAFNEQISEESLPHREQVLSMLKEVVYKDCVGYGTELFYENAAVLIVNMEEASDVKRQHFSKQIAEHLSDFFKVPPTIGVGKICSDIHLINRSFIEASAAIEHHLINDNRHLIYFEDITEAGENPLWYPLENQVQLTQSLKQGDQVVAKEALQNIISHLKSKNTSIQLLRCMCFDVVNTVLKIISELSLLVNIKDVNKLTEFNSLEELEQRLGNLIKVICQKVEKKKENHNYQLRNKILNFIGEEFKSHSISLSSTAEKFELSSSYLSRFIKEQTGSTFTQYVWELRNKAFKEKLIASDDPIKVIVADIGYVDVANFTRKFRKVEGMTPGQYRKRYQKVQDNSESAL